MSSHVFPPGTRVSIEGDCEWPNGTTGTVANWPKDVRDLVGENWEEPHPRPLVTPRGVGLTYWIWFDEPTDDGSGGGPYAGGEVDGQYVRNVDEDLGDP